MHHEEKLRKICLKLTVLLVFMPILGTFLSLIGADAEGRQYSFLQVILMSIYNLPFLAISYGGLLLSDLVPTKPTVSKCLLILSIASSILGSLVMIAWGLGLL